MARLKDKLKPLPERKRQAYQFFIGKGYTPIQSAGIVGNLMAESTLDHTIGKIDSVESSTGIAQWNAKGSPERTDKFKQLYGKPIQQSSFEEQLQYVDWELNNTEKRAMQKLKEATNVNDATFAIRKYYERPAEAYAHDDRRTGHAQSILKEYEGMTFDTATSQAQTQNPVISDQAQTSQKTTVQIPETNIFDENLTYYADPKINRTFVAIPDVNDNDVGEKSKEQEEKENPAKTELDRKIAERNFLTGLIQNGAFNYVAPEYKRTTPYTQQ